TLVPVEDEHRQQSGDLRTHDAYAPEVVLRRTRLLAEDDDIVTGSAPLARERARVHVRARPAEQVAVPEQDPHGSLKSDGSRARRGARPPDSTCAPRHRTARLVALRCS